MSRVKTLRTVLDALDEGDEITLVHHIGDDVEVTTGLYVRTELRDAEWAEGDVQIRTVVVDAEYPNHRREIGIPFVSIIDLKVEETQ